MTLFQKFRDGLRKTQQKLAADVRQIVTKGPNLDSAAFDELEAALISADLGVETAVRIVEQTREASQNLSNKGSQRMGPPDIFAIARAEIERKLRPGFSEPRHEQGERLVKAKVPPTVVLLVGVNGTGKTTSAAKLAYWLKERDNKVLLAACDTFRAAAIEQLKLWSERVGCDVVAGQYGSDSAAVAFDALDAAIHRGVDYLIVDTAGRLHTKKNLMEEMKKIQRTVQKRWPSAPHEVLLVLDGTTGSNAVAQAREFHRALGVTGIVVTKLDGTSKGGIVVAIAGELKIPVKFIGLGEQLDDWQPFDPEEFAKALFGEPVT